MGAELLAEKLGLQSGSANLLEALSGLLGGSGKDIDISSIVQGLMSNSNLQSLVDSWLGDGPNASLEAGDVMKFFGSDKLSSFAAKVGVQTEDAASGLASVLPQMIDKASSGGSLLEAAGGVGGLFDLGRGLFK